jgi:hypothetical protein
MVEIKVNVRQAGNKKYLTSEQILRYLIGKDDQIETLIMCKPESIELAALDQSLYEALGSVKDYDEFAVGKLRKFLEVVDVIAYRNVHGKQKPILRDERVEELRKKALQGL